LDSSLSNEQAAARKFVRKFSNKEIVPLAEKIEMVKIWNSNIIHKFFLDNYSGAYYE
jgi:hypothetical protein